MICGGEGPATAMVKRILVAGVIVAEFLYGIRLPLAICDTTGLTTGNHVQVGTDDDGQATISARGDFRFDKASPRRG